MLKIENTPSIAHPIGNQFVEHPKPKLMEGTKTVDGKLLFWIIVALLMAIVPWFL